MIKIIKGSYGMKVKNIISPVRAGDPPIELSTEQEARLVKLGVAQYVEKQVPAAAKAGKRKKADEQPAEEPEEQPEDEGAPELNAADPVDG